MKNFIIIVAGIDGVMKLTLMALGIVALVKYIWFV